MFFEAIHENEDTPVLSSAKISIFGNKIYAAIYRDKRQWGNRKRRSLLYLQNAVKYLCQRCHTAWCGLVGFVL